MADNADGDSHPAAVGVVERRRVRVWFGSHVLADYRAEAELAERYAAAMSRRFADGAVALRWYGDYPTTTVWDGIDSVVAISRSRRGHRSIRTRVRIPT